MPSPIAKRAFFPWHPSPVDFAEGAGALLVAWGSPTSRSKWMGAGSERRCWSVGVGEQGWRAKLF